MEFTPREVTALFKTLEELGGLQFSDSALLPVQRRIVERITATGHNSLAKYLEFIVTPTGQYELGLALDAITTAETYFLRQQYQFNAFAEEVLPQLLKQNATHKKLTIWSAGCSTGEEPYTLATIALECEQLRDWKVRILGSDLSTTRLAVAREGRYGKSSFRAVDEAFRSKYFSPGPGETEWSVRPEVKRLCQFMQTNLALPHSSSVIGTVDVAFCRNMLIYLSPRAREIATAQLVERLDVGGYLFLGHAESLLETALPLQTVHLKEDIVYRRKEERR
jgi:chemotaxis protein methyltransferase CheR